MVVWDRQRPDTTEAGQASQLGLLCSDCSRVGQIFKVISPLRHHLDLMSAAPVFVRVGSCWINLRAYASLRPYSAGRRFELTWLCSNPTTPRKQYSAT